MSWKPISIETDFRGRVYSEVFTKEVHKEIFWVTRRDSIHRQLTHCSNRPKMFKVNGIRLYEEEKR